MNLEFLTRPSDLHFILHGKQLFFLLLPSFPRQILIFPGLVCLVCGRRGFLCSNAVMRSIFESSSHVLPYSRSVPHPPPLVSSFLFPLLLKNNIARGFTRFINKEYNLTIVGVPL